MGTCIVLGVKYYEEIAIFNQFGERFFYDSEFQNAVGIPKEKLVDLQLHLLSTIDHTLYVSEEEFLMYFNKIIEFTK